ncbi:multidrug efflux MATE transporter CdeA [Arcobacter sp. 15-2]|uniref:MATE family efflux transporter n=1 Tax=Arcobacter sp. 15-2 TaxID=3374109 RepID=UPI00399D0A85
MLKQKPYKVFFKYIIPSILGLLAISSASIIDGYFVGNYVGSIGLASINITYPIISILFGVGLMFAVGSSVMVSKLLGEKKKEEALNIFSKAIVFVTIFSVVSCFFVYLNIDNILYLLNITDELQKNTKVYLSIVIGFLPFIMIGIVLDYFVRADENPNLSFLALISSAIVNIILDYLFIVKLDYGLAGAAWATGLSYSIIILILIPHFFTTKATLKLIKPTGGYTVIFVAMKNGVSEFINESSAGITVMIFNFMMIKYVGASGVAAYTIVTYFIMISIMISFAISDGLQPIVAKHYGAKEFSRIKIFLKMGFSTIFVFSSILVVFVLVNPQSLADLFLDNNSTETKNITIEFLKYTWIAFLFVGLNILITSYLTSIHQPLASASISIVRSLIFPIFFVSILSYFFGLVGVYIALPFSEIFTFLIAFYFFRKFSV